MLAQIRELSRRRRFHFGASHSEHQLSASFNERIFLPLLCEGTLFDLANHAALPQNAPLLNEFLVKFNELERIGIIDILHD